MSMARTSLPAMDVFFVSSPGAVLHLEDYAYAYLDFSITYFKILDPPPL